MLQQLLGTATSALDPTKLTGLWQALMDLIGQTGGLQGLLSKLQEGGLSEQVQSWMSQGPNLPADPSAITAAIGPDQLKAAAENAGMSAQEFAGGLSEALPGIVNKLSPTGELPGVGSVGEALGKIPGGDQFSGLLGGLLGGGSSTPEPSA